MTIQLFEILKTIIQFLCISVEKEKGKKKPNPKLFTNFLKSLGKQREILHLS